MTQKSAVLCYFAEEARSHATTAPCAQSSLISAPPPSQCGPTGREKHPHLEAVSWHRKSLRRAGWFLTKTGGISGGQPHSGTRLPAPVLHFSSLNITPPMLDTHSCIYHWRYINQAIYSVVKKHDVSSLAKRNWFYIPAFNTNQFRLGKWLDVTAKYLTCICVRSVER